MTLRTDAGFAGPALPLNGSVRLTVVMPVYNGMQYLEQAVNSILRQTFRDFLLVTIDDGSTDDSLSYLRSIQDSRVRVVEMEHRQGQGAARNYVIKNCQSDYLAFADADDTSLPTRFERQVEWLDQHPEAGMLGTRISFLSSSGRSGLGPPLALQHETIHRDLLLCRHAVANGTLMFRASTLKQLGGFRVLGAGEDWDLFLRMTEHSKVANLDEILCLYRVHGSSTSAKQAITLHRRYAHACECASLRQRGLAESSFEDFDQRQRTRSMLARVNERMQLTAGLQYRRALVEILEEKRGLGYGRMGLAAILSPQKLLQRLAREFRKTS